MSVTHEQVDQMLSQYKNCKGRTGHLELEIARRRAELERRINNLVAEAATETPVREEGMPHGTGVGNPVERIVLKYADGYIPDDLRAEMEELKSAERELHDKQMVIAYVDAWLSGLNDRERWVIEKNAIENYCWREMVDKLRKEFGEIRSKDSVKRLRDRAMEKIYSFAA